MAGPFLPGMSEKVSKAVSIAMSALNRSEAPLAGPAMIRLSRHRAAIARAHRSGTVRRHRR